MFDSDQQILQTNDKFTSLVVVPVLYYFMYSLALLLYGIYPLPAMHSLLFTLYVTYYILILIMSFGKMLTIINIQIWIHELAL